MLYFADYLDVLMQKTLQFCKTDDDKPALPTASPSLASTYERPDENTIPLFSCYKNNNEQLQ